MTDSAEQIEMLNKVDSDVEKWWKGCLRFAPNYVTDIAKLSGYECFNSRSVPKDTIAKLLFEGIQLVQAQRNLIKDMQGQAHVLKSEAISCQSTVIKLQEELISVKDNQIVDLHSSVKTSVETAVVKSFSEAVQAVQPQCGAPDVRSPPVMTKDTLKSVVKDVVEEEDRGRNVVMFGISEDESQSLDEKINLVFADIDEKPRFEAVRLGTKKKNIIRPVKVSLSSSTLVQQILRKSRGLSRSTNHKTVFVAPDRNAEERAKQRTLVSKLKKKKLDEPNNRHFIRGGTIVSVEIAEK